MLRKENTGLIVIDIQGKLARLVHNSETLISNCEKLIKGAKALGVPIIWLEQNPEKIGATVDELLPLLGAQKPIPKYTFDACEEPKFMQEIRTSSIGTWLICGIESHICVYQTTLHMHRMGYNVHLVCDCISSRTLDNKNLGITKLVNNGIAITGLEMCLYELVQDCRAPEFKEILGLIK